MFKKIKVLVVDDSAFMRRFISDMINSEPDMEVIDTARNGDVAIDKVRRLNPDVVTLDVEMPEKNGLEALKEIKRISSSEVIMLSGLTAGGSSITMEALEAGAFDFVQKPSGIPNLTIASIKEELAEKIRYAKGCTERLDIDNSEMVETDLSSGVVAKGKKIEAVALGASTGGPKVLYEILTKLPKDFKVPVFVVQHMPAGFTQAFANRLNNNSKLKVIEAKDDELIHPGVAYIAPGAYHMLINKGKIKLDTSPVIHGVRPAVDKLFISASEVYASGLLCCVFTGMGKDGAAGVKAVKEKGGFVMAQDEATSVIYGMPKAAYETGCVDMVLPYNKISEEIVRMV